MTITQRILAQVALGAGLVIAVASAVTYGIVFNAAKQRDLQHLETYVAERVRREEAAFRQVEANLDTVRGQFLKRTAAPVPANYQELWAQRFELFPDGAWRSRREFSDGRKFSTMWMHRAAVLTPELQTQILRAQDICDELLPTWRDSFPSLYFNFPGPANIGFDPTIPSWVWDTPPDYDLDAQEWVRLAFPTNNPARNFAWTGVLEEEVTKTPQVAVLLPIYVDDQMVCSVAHSINVRGLMDEATQGILPGVSQMIFRRDGRLIAHPTLKERIIASKGLLTAQESGDAALVRLHGVVTKPADKLFSGYDAVGETYYTVARLAGPDWLFVTAMPRALLQKQAFASAQWVLWSGLLSLALVLGVFTVILRRQVARPLAEFSRATRQVSAGDNTARVAVAGADELGQLAGAFNDMVAKVAARGAELHTLNQTLEERVAERTKKLRESEERFSKAFQASPALIALTRLADGTFIAVNEAFYKISGYTEPEVIGRQALDLNIYAQPQQREEYVRLIQERGSVRDREHVLRTKHGELRTVLSSGEIFELDGQSHLLTVGLDITDRKQAEVEMLRALDREKELSELKSSFIAMVSHEFRTPLGVIVSSTDILSRYLDRLTPAERATHFDSIHSSVRRMAGMMEDVMLLGRFEGGRFECRPDDLHLVAWCRRLGDEMHSATGGRCPIEMQLDLPDPMVRADEKLLCHILTNLISNAVKYSPMNSPVRVQISQQGRDAVFEIADHGRGIPVADQPQLFEAFHRARNVGQIPGTGLGLVIVKRGVDLHGGKISVTSAEGQGTTFIVRLPLFEETSA